MWKPRPRTSRSPFRGSRTMTGEGGASSRWNAARPSTAHAGPGRRRATPSGGSTAGSRASELPGRSTARLRGICRGSTIPRRSSPRASWMGTPTSPCGRWAGGGCSCRCADEGGGGGPGGGRRALPGMGGGSRLGRQRLDRPSRPACPRRGPASPVYLDSLDVHAAWVNSAALAVARITRETPDPPGGRIVRDAVGRAHRAAAGARRGAGRQGGARAVDGDSRRCDARSAGGGASPGRDRHPRRRGRAGLAFLPPPGGRRASCGCGCSSTRRWRRFRTSSAAGRGVGRDPPGSGWAA